MEEDIILLMDEEGRETKFSFLDLIEYKQNEFVVLLPYIPEENTSGGEVVILRVEDSEDEEVYVSEDDDNVLLQVYEIFKEKNKQNFDFVN